MIFLFNQSLSDTSVCGNCTDFIEDAYHYFFVCSRYATFRFTLFQSIQNITGNIYQPELELLLYGHPNYTLNVNIKIFEAVHTYIATTKRFV